MTRNDRTCPPATTAPDASTAERACPASDLASVAGVDALVASILRAQFAAWAMGDGRPPNAVRAVEDAGRHIQTHCGTLLARWATGVLHERYPLKRFPLDPASEATLLRALP